MRLKDKDLMSKDEDKDKESSFRDKDKDLSSSDKDLMPKTWKLVLKDKDFRRGQQHW